MVSKSPDCEGRPTAVLASEFAAVRISVDRNALGPRLLVEDLDSGHHVFLEPLELASFCLANDADRIQWLNVGAYRDVSSLHDDVSAEE